VRTFHTGGVAGEGHHPRSAPCAGALRGPTPKGVAPISEAAGPGADRRHRPLAQGRGDPGRRFRGDRVPGVEAFPADRRGGSSTSRSGSSSSSVRSTRSRCCGSSARVRCRCTSWTRSSWCTAARAWAIHDKHIEVIVRQMLKRVTIIESGDAELLPGELVGAHPVREREPARGGRRRAAGVRSVPS
jgi:DNA-directed RNA polymerase subunit beta'